MVERLRKAIVDKKKVKIIYRKPNGEITERIIHPLYLVTYLSSKYIFGYCELRMDYRIFKLERIKSMRGQPTIYSTERMPFNHYECELPGDLIVDDGSQTKRVSGKNRVFNYHESRDYRIIKAGLDKSCNDSSVEDGTSSKGIGCWILIIVAIVIYVLFKYA